MNGSITVSVQVNLPIEKVWELWNSPEHIIHWNNANEDWHNLKVENEASSGGKFFFAMAKKDGTDHFDFKGSYDEVIINEFMSYTLNDGRKTTITFTSGNPVEIKEVFEPELNTPIDVQRNFCQSVLDRFKQYAEGAH